MKRLLLLLLMCAFVFTFAAACGGSAGEPVGEDLDIDVDLSGESTLIVHGEVNKILSTPRDYLGKRIRMSGPYYFSFADPEFSTRYHYIAVEAADACCLRGLEFRWSGDGAFPDGYPGPMTMIEIVGVYRNYTENGETFHYIDVEGFREL